MVEEMQRLWARRDRQTVSLGQTMATRQAGGQGCFRVVAGKLSMDKAVCAQLLYQGDLE